MSSEIFKLLEDEVRVREDSVLLSEMNLMADIYEGKLPSEYDQFFPRNSPKQIVNLIRLAWDDLATQVGRLPELRAEPLNNSDIEEQRVALLERIGHAYLRNAEPKGKIAMFVLGWWLVGPGRAVAVVAPDVERKTPIISIRDPRTAFPNVRKSAGNFIVELKDIIFKYELGEQEMANRGLATRPATGWEQRGQKRTGTVIEYVDAEKWMIASDGGTVQTAFHGLGVVPAWVFQTFAPNKPALSLFQDQVVFMVAISRMLSQKLRFGDRLAHPLLWVRGYEGSVDLGPETLTKLGPQGEMGQIAPPTQLQVDRDIEMLERFSRILNRNPESRQGEIQAKGTYTSAKTLEQLAEAIDTVVGRMWDIVSVGMQHLLRVCFAMDEQFWGNQSKSISGIYKGNKILDRYMPSKDIAGRWHINVDYGFDIGGYQGFLQQVQMVGAKLQSRRGALERMPGMSDVDDKLREIEIEAVDEAAIANFLALAAQGQLDMVIVAKLRKQMAEEGKPLFEIIIDYEEELKKQAQAAMGQGGAEAMTTAPAPAPEAMGLPSLPPMPGMGL